METEVSEVIMIVDACDTPIGGAGRSDAIKANQWRRVCGGVVIDRLRGLVLCHRRSGSKDERPGVWVATFGGKSKPEEAPIETAERELYEEFGVVADNDAFHFHRKEVSEQRRQFEYLFWVPIDSEETKIVLKDGEVEGYRWCTPEYVLAKLQADTSWYEYGYEAELILERFPD